MITVLGESFGREELEAKFLREHASFAHGWVLSREGRTTRWVSSGNTLKIEVTLVAHEYKDPRDAAGHFADALEWNEVLYKRQGDGWTPAAVHVGPREAKKKLVTKSRRSR